MSTRRNLLTAAAASLGLPGAVTAASISVTGMPAAHPDAELIAACGEYLRSQREFEIHFVSLPGDMADDDPAWAILDRLPELRNRIAAFRATTAEGHYARACCAAFHYLPNHAACRDDAEGSAEDRFRAANLRDAVDAVRGSAKAGFATADELRQVAHSYAELIAVCAEFDACERQTCIIHGDGPDCVVDDDEANAASAPIFARMHVLLDRMDKLRATTPAGIQARAHSLALHGGHLGYSFDYPDTMVGRLLIYLMRDSAALDGSVAIVPMPASPDDALLEACAAYHACEASRPRPDLEMVCGTQECDEREKINNAITERADEMVHALADMPALTRESMQAKARAILLWDGGNALKGEPDDYSGDRLLASLLRDLLAGRMAA